MTCEQAKNLPLTGDNKLVTTESSSMVESNTLIPLEAAQVAISEELTHDEQRDRQRLELGVEQAFYQAGKALAELRHRRLYRSTHKTFAAYCRDRFGFTRRHSDYLIAGAVVVENLQAIRTIPSQNQFHENSRTIRSQILPTKLEQIKPLTSLKPDQQRQVWNKAVATAHGKVPSGRIVKGIVKQIEDKPLVLAQDYCQVGDVFTLVRLKGKERKYNGCCCIAVKLTDLTVLMVDVHDATITVRPENLAKIDSPDMKRQLSQTLKRIRQLREVGSLDRGADNVLEDLGRHTALTPVEESLLSWLENYYKVYEQESRA